MDLPQLKARLPLATVLDLYGLTPDRSGMVRCPFHDDRTPSMQVSGETAYCHATGCERHGRRIDVIDFVMYKEGLTKHEAIVRCKGLVGEALLKGAGIGKGGARPADESEAPAEGAGEEPVDLDAAYETFVMSLARSRVAREYAARRGLADVRDVGYNPGRQVVRSLRECLVFALRDRGGRVVSLYGRVANGRKRGRHYYTKGRRGLYPSYPPADTERIVLCESVIDAATVGLHTEWPVLALYGTGGLTGEHLAALEGLESLREVVLFMDGDEAGRAARAKWAGVLQARLRAGVCVSAVATPAGEDANSLALGEGPEILAHLIEEREAFYPSPEPASPEVVAAAPVAPSPETPSLEAVAAPVERESEPESGSDVGDFDATDAEALVWRAHGVRFTALGGVSPRPADRMKVTLKIERLGSRDPLHRVRTAVDLYRDEAVERVAAKVAGRLEVSGTQLLRDLLALTERLEAYRAERLAAERAAARSGAEEWRLTPERRRRALAFLAGDNLLGRTAAQIAATGVVGERDNALVLWLAFTTRLRERPLHVVCLGASGTGKTYLQEKVAALVPPGDKLEVTALSDNALYYFGRTELAHKLVLVEDLDGAGGQGQEGVMYALRELQSKGRITKTVALKDARGNLKTVTLSVEGPVCLAATTTRERLYEDNANRSLLLYLDGSPEQREAVLAYQREASAGAVDRSAERRARDLMRDVQAVLAEASSSGAGGPVRVVNPYARALRLPAECFAPLRTQAHYLTFVEAVTFYHQAQRERKVDGEGRAYVETTLADIAAANALLVEVIAAKSDELARASRRVLERLRVYIEKRGGGTFYSGEVRRAWRMAPTTINRHVDTLRRYGYVRVVGGSRARGYEYELTEGEGGRPVRERVAGALERVLDELRARELSGDEGQDEQWPGSGPLENRVAEGTSGQAVTADLASVARSANGQPAAL